MWLDDHPTALYRLYDTAGVLLYIGISHDPDTRFIQHSRDKAWWPNVARREVQWFDDRPAAAAAEADAIRKEDPEHNGTYSPRRDRRTIRDVQAADGVREVSLTIARARLGTLVHQVSEGGPVVALLEHGRRRAYVVSSDFYEQALRDAALLQELRQMAEEPQGEGVKAEQRAKARVIHEALDTAARRTDSD